MKAFRLRFVSPIIEAEYKKIKQSSMKSFFKLLIYILVITCVLAIVQGIRLGSLSTFLETSALLIVCLVILRYGYRVERCLDFILAIMCLFLYLLGVISSGHTVSTLTTTLQRTAITMYNAGYFVAIFERIVIQELTRLELKVAFSTASLIARIIMWPPPSNLSYINFAFYYLLSLFADIRREKNDRSLFKSFYDYREEIIKFKDLLVSGLPTNILILTKDIKKKLFVNEYFHSTFLNDLNDDRWSPREWLTWHRIERDSIQNEELREEIQDSLDLEETILVMMDKGLLTGSGKNVTFNTKVVMPDTNETHVFEVKVISSVWDGQDAIIIVLNDVTQQYANLSLKIANTNKDKMIAMVSHELRTPLNGILGMIHIMEKKISDQEVLKYLTVCKSSGSLLLNLVNSILDLGQIRSNKFKLTITKGNLAELLGDLYLLFDFQFKQKQLYFKIETAADIPKFIVTDLNRLKQVLINLISNALKFTFEGGVCVRVSRDRDTEGNLLFEVSDTGIGIKEDEKRKLFKMYGKLEQADQKINADGVGLGLTISDHLVRLLAFNRDEEGIQVESTFGKGTSLFFSIKENLSYADTIIKNDEIDMEVGNVSITEEGNTDLFRRVSSYVIHSHIGLNTNVSPLEIPSSARKIHGSPSNRDKIEKPYQRLTSIADNEDDVLIKRTGQKGEVLLVDDNPFNIMVAKSLVEGLGYHVKTALNGKIAVDMVKNASESLSPFNIVLMDCQMPVMDGFEATVLIRKMIETGEITDVSIVALSANDSEDDKKRCKDVGMDDHLSKPVSEARIKTVLDKYCKRNSLG